MHCFFPRDHECREICGVDGEEDDGKQGPHGGHEPSESKDKVDYMRIISVYAYHPFPKY